MLMMMMMFKMLTSMRLDYLHRSSVTNTLAWNLTLWSSRSTASRD